MNEPFEIIDRKILQKSLDEIALINESEVQVPYGTFEELIKTSALAISLALKKLEILDHLSNPCNLSNLFNKNNNMKEMYEIASKYYSQIKPPKEVNQLIQSEIDRRIIDLKAEKKEIKMRGGRPGFVTLWSLEEDKFFDATDSKLSKKERYAQASQLAREELVNQAGIREVENFRKELFLEDLKYLQQRNYLSLQIGFQIWETYFKEITELRNMYCITRDDFMSPSFRECFTLLFFKRLEIDEVKPQAIDYSTIKTVEQFLRNI